MYSPWVVPLVAVVFFIWLVSLSIIIWKEKAFLKTIFPKSGERDIRKKFEENSSLIGGFDLKINSVKRQVEEIEKIGLGHISRVELLRYNPYDDTGGDQSFSVALLNSEGNGVVFTSLHARSGTRVFAKPVIKAKAAKYQFSKEEEQVVINAFKQ